MAGGQPGGNVPIVLMADNATANQKSGKTFYLTPTPAACGSPTRPQNTQRRIQTGSCCATARTPPAEARAPRLLPAPKPCAPAPTSAVARPKHRQATGAPAD